MAYYGSDLYKDDAGDFYRTCQYPTSYDIVPFQNSESYSSYEFGEPEFSEYSSTSYDPYLSRPEIHYSTCSAGEPKLIEYSSFQDSVSCSSYEFSELENFKYISNAYGSSYSYDPFVPRSEIHYSAYSVSQPKLIEYNPIHFSYEIQYVVSYNSAAPLLDDTEFEEYDPTSYGGGYNPTLTYGKPLPPSDEICYPRSLPGPNGVSPDNISYGSIPPAYGKDVADDIVVKPSNESKPSKDVDEKQQPQVEKGDNEKPSDSSQEEKGDGDTGDDRHAWSGHDYGNGNIWNQGYGYDGYGYDRQVPQTPYGYGSGLEAVDLCESLFGYWPCLRRYNRRRLSNGHEGARREECQETEWKRVADYLFGGPYSHGGGHEAAYYGEPTYNCEGHCHYAQSGGW